MKTSYRSRCQRTAPPLRFSGTPQALGDKPAQLERVEVIVVEDCSKDDSSNQLLDEGGSITLRQMIPPIEHDQSRQRELFLTTTVNVGTVPGLLLD